MVESAERATTVESNVNHTLRHKCNIQIMVKFTGFSVFFAVFGELVVRQP